MTSFWIIQVGLESNDNCSPNENGGRYWSHVATSHSMELFKVKE
jgi:hypothetical protein